MGYIVIGGFRVFFEDCFFLVREVREMEKVFVRE